MSIRVRFAPSPTGALHIGGLRTALFNYLFAKKHNGEFILRIEDTDQNRKVDGAEDYITASLSWLGIEQDEGPKKRGGFGPYRQSERKEIYEQEIIKLIQTGKAYYAFDSDEKLAELRREYEKKGESFKYCSLNRNDLLNSLSLSEKETKKRIKEENYVVRLKVESGISVTVEDKIRGEIKVNSDEIDDKILIKADGMPTYHFANVVDDHHMKISHVIRGEEWLPSLPLHQLIYYAFDWTVPEFMHLPLILKPEGKGKLSKRDGDQLGFPVYPLKWNGNIGFKERGFLPEALLNYISLLGWNPGAEKEIFELEELIRLFDIGKIQKGGARFDFNKARWINHKFIERSESKSVLERFPAFFSIMSIVKSEKNKLAIYELLKERLFLLEDFKSEANLLFNDPTTYDEKIIKKIENSRLEKTLNLFIELIEKDIPAANWKQELQTWNEKVNIPFGVILQSLRLAIVGSLSGPDIFSVCGLLEKEVTLRRLKKLIIYLNN
jgi:glutamyl-tRNA synthetase